MDDRTQADHDRTSPPREHSAPSASTSEDFAQGNGRHGTTAERLSSSKPALTDRERRERWPVD